MKSVVVETHKPEWRDQFAKLKARLWPSVSSFAVGIEHVGSTSVPELAAKPVIDIDIVIPDETYLRQTIEALAPLGYEHRGDLGIAGREAFKAQDTEIAHHLYVCAQGSDALRNHLLLREALRQDAALRDKYSALKFELAAKFASSIDDYIAGKTAFILKILERSGMGSQQLSAIEQANSSPLPRFETARLFLRGVRREDAASYKQNFVDYEVIRHLSAAVPWPYPENGIVDFIENYILPNQGNDHWMWGVFLKQNPNELIGVVDLWREGKPENRGFWLARKHWGQGLMTEAVAPVMDYAFSVLGFEKLILANAVGNIGSRRVKEKTGSKFLGVKPAKFVDPAYTEHELWELTKEAWQSRRPR